MLWPQGFDACSCIFCNFSDLIQSVKVKDNKDLVSTRLDRLVIISNSRGKSKQKLALSALSPGFVALLLSILLVGAACGATLGIFYATNIARSQALCGAATGWMLRM